MFDILQYEGVVHRAGAPARHHGAASAGLHAQGPAELDSRAA